MYNNAILQDFYIEAIVLSDLLQIFEKPSFKGPCGVQRNFDVRIALLPGDHQTGIVKPKITTYPGLVISRKKSDADVKISLDATRPFETRLLKDLKKVRQDDRLNIEILKDGIVVHISNVRDTDAGTYLVIVTNQYGSDDAVFDFHVIGSKSLSADDDFSLEEYDDDDDECSNPMLRDYVPPVAVEKKVPESIPAIGDNLEYSERIILAAAVSNKESSAMEEIRYEEMINLARRRWSDEDFHIFSNFQEDVIEDDHTYFKKPRSR
ncbi:hypothetical protein CDAR_200631 [Caerostris darwini]|uniref:Immunoglobulin I-set domain-containing protein n=1 Tax=Caerostris darwini TaxID=1538125 RepID=A0AAV4TZY4_9ARAC|nr:hypothetical protein CDAR_200631 [Caerostris darwini]